ncbi:acetate uptake transporter [Methanobrevibacter sp. TMH8]|uniref:acetate uptake transporter n=1 Tax=Methanobrevibacter sp. TMH8 TaxID=2848611 RepID=UPI001CC92FE6|nr:acetate uptake transporter [Methanobrevibacter sp. TMH8]MBZ9571148.1 acetate uptake transporter [Methanobrevibacter sp. TMH8]
MSENTFANPSPLGLFGFGITTILLSLHNAGIIELSTVILAVTVCLGGIAQTIAGIFEMKFNNTFGGTAFISFGFFWISLAMIWILPGIGQIQPADPISMAFYLLIFGCFTSFMFISSLKHIKILQVLFGVVSILFFLLAAADFTGIGILGIIAGYLGIFLGAAAIYACIGQIINNDWEKDIFKL